MACRGHVTISKSIIVDDSVALIACRGHVTISKSIIFKYNVAIDESRFCIPRISKPESERSNRCRYNTVKSQCTQTADCRRYAWQIFASKSATFGSVDNATHTCNRRTTHAREATADPQLGLLSKCCSSSSRASRSRKSRDCKQDTRWSAAACC